MMFLLLSVKSKQAPVQLIKVTYFVILISEDQTNQLTESVHGAESLRIQEALRISHMMWKVEVYYKNTPLVTIMGQFNPVYIFPFCFFEIYFSNIFPSVCRFSKLSLFFRFS